MSDSRKTDEVYITSSCAEMASLSGISYELGVLRPIDELDFLQDDPRKLELFKIGGFKNYAHSDLSMRELGYAAAVNTLREAGVDRREIGICLYVAESFDRDEAANSLEVNRLLLDLDLGHTVPINVSISNCANIMSALRLATALIAVGDTQHVLIVSVDKASRRYGGRRMFQDMSIKSDISVSCMVSGPGKGRYGIHYLKLNNAAALIEAELSDSAAYAMEKFKGIRRAGKEARNRMAVRPADFARVVTNNYSYAVIKMFVELCGFPKERGAFTNVGRFAHAVAGDVLINLQDLETEGAFQPGDLIFLMADSISAASVLCLQRNGNGHYAGNVVAGG